MRNEVKKEGEYKKSNEKKMKEGKMDAIKMDEVEHNEMQKKKKKDERESGWWGHTWTQECPALLFCLRVIIFNFY